MQIVQMQRVQKDMEKDDSNLNADHSYNTCLFIVNLLIT